jgi:hypothetical protein
MSEDLFRASFWTKILLTLDRGVDTRLRFCSRQLWNVRIFRVFSRNAWLAGVLYELCALLTKFNGMRELSTKFHEMREFLAKCTDFQKIFFVYSGQYAIILAVASLVVNLWINNCRRIVHRFSWIVIDFWEFSMNFRILEEWSWISE